MTRPPDRRSHRRWRRIAAAIIARDGGVCWLCGGEGADSADHLIPMHLGGPDTPDNLRAAHVRCNSRRNDRRPHAATPAGLGRPSRIW